MKRAIGVEAIIDYKLLKAAVGVVAGLLFLALLLRGTEAGAATLAQMESAVASRYNSGRAGSRRRVS